MALAIGAMNFTLSTILVFARIGASFSFFVGFRPYTFFQLLAAGEKMYRAVDLTPEIT
ncbi:hypothetical protein [Ferrimonas balearica]|uniref:hypothetical protein n=1 Tax=Ferrimonas balearica TaxID=44012 RepID=UPI001F273A67|nr:hypothetical protein [Ferrimonas balearica]MBY6019826.1 hypothetical protein [Halomonas denitrificans]MBY6096893.1 hypothetical protein [Ferrimonas balearica]